VAGILSASAALGWAWANATGRLPEPERDWQEPVSEFGSQVTNA
jgi:hypothetical protein